MEDQLHVRVLLFAAYRELIGERTIDVELPSGSSASDLFTLLVDRKPELSRLRPYTTFAVNQEVQPADVPLRSGDVVAFLQPLSGGC